jgi:magnesium transporter
MRYEIKFPTFDWIDIKNPTVEDCDFLTASFHLHPLVAKEILPQLDHPKVENFGNYISLVIFYPFFDKKSFCTVPFELDIIAGRDFIITNHYQDLVPLKIIFDQCNLYEETRYEYSRGGPGEVLYRVLREILMACFPKLNHIGRNIEEIESLIYKGEYRQAVGRISLARRDIIGFQRIMQPQHLVMKNLAREAEVFFRKELLPYFHSLITLQEQVNAILETNDRVLSSLESTNQSLLNDRINNIIKVLTIFSVIVFPLMLFPSLFSMNISSLPLSSHPKGFLLVLGLMLAGCLTAIAVFKRKKWI